MIEKSEIQERINQAESRILTLKAFLSSKDYQTIREMQGGEPMTEETKRQCADARVEINRLEAQIEVWEQEMEELDDEPQPPIDDIIN